MTWVVVGASAGLGRALAARLAADRRDLLLTASDPRDLDALAADLAIRFGVRARTVAHDAADAAGLAGALTRAVGDDPVEGLLFPVGLSEDDDDGALPPDRGARLAAVNYLSVAAVSAAFLPRLIAQGNGILAGFGSVAAARGRGRNVVYAASKRALESHFEGLRHALEPRGIRVCFFVLGYMDTALAYGKTVPFPKADPAAVAEAVVRALGRNGGRRHLPGWWAAITFAVRALPWTVYRRMRF